MKKRATAQEVAEAAGVSKWTVIRAFTEGASITPDTKKRILKVAEKLNYTPNLLARSLATNLTHQVAVFVDDFANPEKLPFLEALTDRLQAAGLVAMLININTHFDHVQALLSAGQRRVDAIVLLGTSFREETLQERHRKRGSPPLFVLARDSRIENVPAVLCDSEKALRDIVEHLARRGYRKPGFMSGASALSTALMRQHYFEECWKEYGVASVRSLTAGRYSAEEGGNAMRQYLAETAEKDRIDVIMCENDILALGAMDVIRGEFGMNIPRDLAVVGFDNFDLGGSSAFNLTTYEQPVSQMMDTLVAMIKGQIPAETVSLHGQLVVRKST